MCPRTATFERARVQHASILWRTSQPRRGPIKPGKSEKAPPILTRLFLCCGLLVASEACSVVSWFVESKSTDFGPTVVRRQASPRYTCRNWCPRPYGPSHPASLLLCIADQRTEATLIRASKAPFTQTLRVGGRSWAERPCHGLSHKPSFVRRWRRT